VLVRDIGVSSGKQAVISALLSFARQTGVTPVAGGSRPVRSPAPFRSDRRRRAWPGPSPGPPPPLPLTLRSHGRQGPTTAGAEGAPCQGPPHRASHQHPAVGCDPVGPQRPSGVEDLPTAAPPTKPLDAVGLPTAVEGPRAATASTARDAVGRGRVRHGRPGCRVHACADREIPASATPVSRLPARGDDGRASGLRRSRRGCASCATSGHSRGTSPAAPRATRRTTATGTAGSSRGPDRPTLAGAVSWAHRPVVCSRWRCCWSSRSVVVWSSRATSAAPSSAFTSR
jgi:hypothetical protein